MTTANLETLEEFPYFFEVTANLVTLFNLMELKDFDSYFRLVSSFVTSANLIKLVYFPHFFFKLSQILLYMTSHRSRSNHWIKRYHKSLMYHNPIGLE